MESHDMITSAVVTETTVHTTSTARTSSSSINSGGSSSGANNTTTSQQHIQQQQQQQQQQHNNDDDNEVESVQQIRRKKIQEIMKDKTLNQKDKSLMIQSLMDGRRRSSCASNSSNSTGAYDDTNNTDDDQYNNNNNNNNSMSMIGSSYHDDNNDSNIVATRYVNSMARAAAIAADYYSSDDDADMTSDDDNDHDIADDAAIGPDHYSYGYETTSDHRSCSSSSSLQNPNEYYEYQSQMPLQQQQHQYHQQQQQLYGSMSNMNLTDNSHQQQQQQHQQPGTTYRQLKGRSMSLQDWNNDEERDAAFASTLASSNMNSFLNQLSSNNNTCINVNSNNNNNQAIINPKMVSKLMELSRPSCDHYDRNCTIISFCCGLAFGCRICHDECPILPPPLQVQKQRAAAAAAFTKQTTVATRPIHHHLPPPTSLAVERRHSMPLDFDDNDNVEETHHLIDRFAIREVICRHCYERQSSKTNNCIKCGIRFAEYHCKICNLWMSEQEMPYHCEQCGFCRVGGRENFTHCDDCGMCIDTQLFHDHNCKSGKYMSNCPICQEDLFSSRFASHEMPCGHAIHWHCFKELTSYDSRCPVCKKTAESPEQMHATWSAIAMGIALQPVPPEMARVVDIVCNDCEQYDYNRRWHFLGVRCNNCLSFNTVIEQLILNGQEAADFLDELEARQGLATEGGGIPISITAGLSSTSFTGAAGTNIGTGNNLINNNEVRSSNNININDNITATTTPQSFNPMMTYGTYSSNTTPNHNNAPSTNHNDYRHNHEDDDDMDIN